MLCRDLLECGRRVPMRRANALCLALLLWLMGSTTAQADRLMLAVASNFQPTAQELAARFMQEQGHTVVLLAGSTGRHYAQIRNGAPVDVFLAADQARPRRLEQEGRAVPGSRMTYALGGLLLWSPDPDTVDAEGRVLHQPPLDARLAVANPKLAPYGLAAQQVLQHLGLEPLYAERRVLGENIGQTFQFVKSGAAPFGFVARAQVQQLPLAEQGASWPVPAALHAPIAQDAVIVRDSAAARAWMAYLSSPEARAVIARYGYTLPEEGP